MHKIIRITNPEDETPTPTMSPSPCSESYIKYEARLHPSSDFEERQYSINLNLYNNMYCMEDYVQDEYCQTTSYSGYNKWINGDFSDDFRVISYVDCNGVEHFVSSIHYQLRSISSCGSEGEGGSPAYSTCFRVLDPTPTPTPDCPKITWEVLNAS